MIFGSIAFISYLIRSIVLLLQKQIWLLGKLSRKEFVEIDKESLMKEAIFNNL